MLVVPYLSTEKIDEILSSGVSCIDLCGNGGVVAAGLFQVYRTGLPNKYPTKSSIRYAFRGDSSLVTRSFLLQPSYTSVSDIQKFVASRGGSVVMSTVSKVLKRLEEELYIDRSHKRSIRLIEPEALLTELQNEYRPAKVEDTWLGKVDISQEELVTELSRISKEGDIVRTGINSADNYITFAGENIVECYTQSSIKQVLNSLQTDARETKSFPNLRFIETGDQRVFFDAQPNLMASPLQTWLEMTSGDKRSI